MIKNLIKINNLKLKIIFLLISLLCYLSIVQATNAASLSLSIDPPIILINAVPPTTAVSKLSIQNKGNTKVTLQIQLKAFQAKGENGELEYSKEASQIFRNIQIMDAGVTVESITLNPGQQKNLTLNINIPKKTDISHPTSPAALPESASLGSRGELADGRSDYYFSVIFVSTDSFPIESNSSVNQIGVAANILLSVGQKEISKAYLEEFSSKSFLEKGPVSFTVRVKNTDAHFIRPKGEIDIKNMFGQNIGRLELMNVNILSNSIRAIPNEDSFDPKRPTALWKESFLLGLYTATLNISMSDEGPIFTKSIYFFAFPFKALIVIAVIAISIIAVKNKLKTHMNKDRIKV